ncbi:MAG: hypothetical protein IJT05_09360 [Lachnospiraceae bacterium]|nr:hypothetical protein [Lachnospiraceae bacterium]
MTKKKTILWQALFFAMLVLPTLLFLLFFRGKEAETYENRTPVAPPNLTLANLENVPDEITEYYNDNLPFRSTMVSLYSYGIYRVFHDAALPNVVVGKENWLFYDRKDDGTNIQDYKGMCQFSEEHLAQIAAQLTEINNSLSSQGCQFILYIVPDKDHIYPEYMPDYIAGPGPSRSYGLTNYLRENTDLTVLYPTGELLSFKEENEEDSLYYHYDTHWNALGAYLGSKSLLNVLGVEPVSLYEMEVEKTNDSEYDLADLLAIRNFVNDDVGYSITDPYHKKAKLVEDDGGECLVLKSRDEDADPRHILLFRDSFADQLSPYLAPRFKKTTLLRRTGTGESESYHKAMETLPDVFIYEISERYLDELLGFRLPG